MLKTKNNYFFNDLNRKAHTYSYDINNLKCGVETFWYTNGCIWEEITWKKNVRNGFCVVFGY
jgi:antitoxin component YwqK of YwqJK toxin-antitoxin module